LTPLYLLTDYKGQFGYKYLATPYRSGFDKELLSDALRRRAFEPVFIPLASVRGGSRRFANQLVVYTSSEDEDLHYKGFIEDVVLALQLQGARLVPRFEHLRAHHNKVFMEMLRDLTSCPEARSPAARYYGTLEDLIADKANIPTPAVLKPAAGAMSAGVKLASTADELVKAATSLSRCTRIRPRARDLARRIRRRGYVAESWHRRKFVVQDFVPSDHDWKVLVYGDKSFVVRRGARPNDFRASGSGILDWPQTTPAPVLDVSTKLARALDVPWLSVDVIYADGIPHVLEFQVLHFGTAALEKSPGFFVRRDTNWQFQPAASIVEEEFAEALAAHVRRGT
jgi:glutathione synthase/RimK-type ligase-like ATP-grasp enzyme